MSKWIDDIMEVLRDTIYVSDEQEKKIRDRLQDLVLVVRFE